MHCPPCEWIKWQSSFGNAVVDKPIPSKSGNPVSYPKRLAALACSGRSMITDASGNCVPLFYCGSNEVTTFGRS